MSGILNGKYVQEYVYDFAVDGGANGSNIVLSDKDGKKPIPIGAIVTNCVARVVTACTSDGSATVSWGNDDAENGYSGTTIAVGSLTDNSIWSPGVQGSESLLWDDSNDHNIFFPVINADDGDFIVLISDADLTAGKILFMVEYLLPTEA